MKAYVVNMASSSDRRRYMEQLLCNHPGLSIEFIDAVNGKQLSDQRQRELFDFDKFSVLMQRRVRPGEIGCTLSHQKCYRQLIESGERYAIIFEDDLVINEPFDEMLPAIEQWLDCDEPRLLLLSGWFWFISSRDFNANHQISRVFDGYLTHAYALNRAAAKLMTDSKPWYAADAWHLFVKRGVNICGLRPHLFDQDWSGVFKTTIQTESKTNVPFSLKVWMNIKRRTLIQHILSLCGKFEKAEKNKQAGN